MANRRTARIIYVESVALWEKGRRHTMGVPAESHGGLAWRRQLRDPEVTVALVAAACMLVQAVVAKNVIDVELDYFSQFVPLWIYIAYLVSGSRDRRSEIAFIAAIILSVVAVLVLYAI